MEKLKQRWGIQSNKQLLVIIIVFAINGTLSARISSFLMSLLGLTKENLSFVVYYIILLVLVLPIYPFLLIGIGYLLGQFAFFYKFSKKMLQSMGLGFVFKN